MLLILALAIVGYANAQKGTVLVGGNIGFTSENVDQQNDERKTNSFVFSPKVGYQFTDNWTLGGEFAITTSKSTALNSESKYRDFRVGAFARYTMPLNETFAVFADLGAGFQNRTNKNYMDDILSSDSKADGFYTTLTPALFINMKKGFGLNFSIGGVEYQTLKFDENETKYNSFSFNFGKTVNIGVSKNF